MRRELHSKFRAPFSSEDEHFRSHQAENPLCAARQASTCACTFERVANEVDNNVSVIDTATNMVVATVPMGDDQEWPSRLAANKPVTLRTLATPTSLP